METQKIVNLLNDTDNKSSKFATRKWYVINNQNNAEYGCDYSDTYVLVTGGITATGGDASTKVVLKNCDTFRRCVTHINDEHIETVEDLDITMPLYNLIDYSNNYANTSGSMWQSKRDELPSMDVMNPTISVVNSAYFKYKSSTLENPAVNGVLRNAKLVYF